MTVTYLERATNSFDCDCVFCLIRQMFRQRCEAVPLLDLISGYYNLPLHEDSAKCITFSAT